MKIRAVIDAKDRLAVRAIAGNRDHYQPLEFDGQCCDSVTAAKRMMDRFGVRDFYLADLDAISGQVADWESIHQIANVADSLWFDIGIGSVQRLEVVASQLQSLPSTSVAIFGLESLSDIQILEAAISSPGPEQICFSLDLRDGKPVTGIPEWREAPPDQIALQVIQLGFRKLILLDLAAVGTKSGCPTLQLGETIRRQSRNLLPAKEHLEIVAGGGIRGAADVRELENAKVDQALVATALEQVTLENRG